MINSTATALIYEDIAVFLMKIETSEIKDSSRYVPASIL